GKARCPWNCDAPPTSRGCGESKDGPRRRVTSWPRSTPASPRGSPPPTSKPRKRCSSPHASPERRKFGTNATRQGRLRFPRSTWQARKRYVFSPAAPRVLPSEARGGGLRRIRPDVLRRDRREVLCGADGFVTGRRVATSQRCR